MVDKTLQSDLENLKKLRIDLEKQMLNFDEVVPYERQRTAQIYSPRLLNMMLVCGAQIEAVTRLISRRCDFVVDGGIPAIIRKINQKAVLSNFHIVSIPHEVQFTPFTRDLEFWEAYNELKHELKEKQFKITYTTVMDAFAALAALHRLANAIINTLDKNIPDMLNAERWHSDQKSIQAYTISRKPYEASPFWRSLLFEIRSIYTTW